MDLRKLKALIELVQSSGISELEITEGEERVRVQREVETALSEELVQRNPLELRARSNSQRIGCVGLIGHPTMVRA